jgi:hypothetical protein
MRQEPRFATRDALPVQVSLTAAGVNYPGRLADLSFSGARVETESPLAFETTVELSLNCPTAGFDLKVEAVVRWSRPAGEGGWLVGLAFESVVSKGRIAEFFTRGIIDRRGKPRVSVQLEAAAKFELLTDEAKIQLLNASPGGCCLAVESPCREGQKVRFTPPEMLGETLLAEICWVRRVEDRWLAGCRYLPECPRDTVEALCRKMQAPEQRREKWMLAVAMLLALTAGAAAWTWALMT